MERKLVEGFHLYELASLRKLIRFLSEVVTEVPKDFDGQYVVADEFGEFRFEALYSPSWDKLVFYYDREVNVPLALFTNRGAKVSGKEKAKKLEMSFKDLHLWNVCLLCKYIPNEGKRDQELEKDILNLWEKLFVEEMYK